VSDAKINVRTGYASLVLAVLVLVYAFNFMDRYIFVIMMESIKKDLGLSDTQLGLVSGVAFSSVYSLSGLAMAYRADVGNRRTIIACGLAAWSVLTGLCGLAGNFVQLLFARMGVGIAESTCSPPAHSLLADLFPPRHRALAFSIYSAGLPLGLALGFVFGGWIGARWGWRAAFVAGAIPGLLLAPIMRLVVREPVRGGAEAGQFDSRIYSVRAALSYMGLRPSFVAYMVGAALYNMASSAVDYWGPLFLIRVHGMPSEHVGLWSGVLASTGGLTGGLLAGWLADRLAVRDVRWNLGVSTLGIAMVVPLTLLFIGNNPGGALWVLYFFVAFFNSFSMPPTIAITQRLVPIRMRSLASAVMLLGYNFIGVAGCSFVIGFFSDLWARTSHEHSLAQAMALTQIAALLGVVCMTYAIFRMPRDFPEHFAPKPPMRRFSAFAADCVRQITARIRL
jgi:MFS family permease